MEITFLFAIFFKVLKRKKPTKKLQSNTSNIIATDDGDRHQQFVVCVDKGKKRTQHNVFYLDLMPAELTKNMKKPLLIR